MLQFCWLVEPGQQSAPLTGDGRDSLIQFVNSCLDLEAIPISQVHILVISENQSGFDPVEGIFQKCQNTRTLQHRGANVSPIKESVAIKRVLILA